MVVITLFVVCLPEGLALHKNCSIDFHKIRWKDGTQARDETIGFWWYLNLLNAAYGA